MTVLLLLRLKEVTETPSWKQSVIQDALNRKPRAFIRSSEAYLSGSSSALSTIPGDGGARLATVTALVWGQTCCEWSGGALQAKGRDRTACQAGAAAGSVSEGVTSGLGAEEEAAAAGSAARRAGWTASRTGADGRSSGRRAPVRRGSVTARLKRSMLFCFRCGCFAYFAACKSSEYSLGGDF